MLLKSSVEKLMHRQNLDSVTCGQVLSELLQADANPLQSAAFLVLLRAKKETPEELFGLVSALRQTMIPVFTKHRVLDIVGTGGDGANTVNISTGSAILAASCGVKIAKHGNRAVSSLAGSADVLEALGVAINLTPEKISQSIDQVGIGFCFSPNFHPAMRELRQLRRQLNLPSTFNILGPLLNPVNPAHLLLGVYDESPLTPMAATLQKTGAAHAMVVHGAGLDEISCIGEARIVEITPAAMMESTIDPEQLGFSRCRLTDLKGGDAHTNAQLLRAVFSGKLTTPSLKAIADTLVLNAALALYLYGQHNSIVPAIADARENLLSGMALTLLKNWIEFSHD